MEQNTTSAGMKRAQRVEAMGKEFIVIAQDEPYFAEVYGRIRIEEMRKGTWTDEDEAAFRALVQS